MTKNIALILAASLLLAANVARAEQNVTHKPHHASLSCQTCHGDTKNKVPPRPPPLSPLGRSPGLPHRPEVAQRAPPPMRHV